jgi:hypothetical protein
MDGRTSTKLNINSQPTKNTPIGYIYIKIQHKLTKNYKNFKLHNNQEYTPKRVVGKKKMKKTKKKK